MSYDKQTWQRGDVITANKLNHMEDGIATGGGVIEVHVAIEEDVYTLDKTWNELKQSLASGNIILIHWIDDDAVSISMLTQCVYVIDEGYLAVFLNATAGEAQPTSTIYTANSAEDYPSYDDN